MSLPQKIPPLPPRSPALGPMAIPPARPEGSRRYAAGRLYWLEPLIMAFGLLMAALGFGIMVGYAASLWRAGTLGQWIACAAAALTLLGVLFWREKL